MRKIFAIFLFLVTFAVSNVQAQKLLCFENKGLKLIQRISFELEGSRIKEGYFETMSYDTDTSAETFAFSGTKTGVSLSIKFAGTIPYERPPRTKSISVLVQSEPAQCRWSDAAFINA